MACTSPSQGRNCHHAAIPQVVEENLTGYHVSYKGLHKSHAAPLSSRDACVEEANSFKEPSCLFHEMVKQVTQPSPPLLFLEAGNENRLEQAARAMSHTHGEKLQLSSHTSNVLHGSSYKGTPICLKKMHSFTHFCTHMYITSIKLREVVWNTVGCSVGTVWCCLYRGCVPKATHTSTATTAFCSYYHYYYIPVSMPASLNFCYLHYFNKSSLCCPYLGNWLFLIPLCIHVRLWSHWYSPERAHQMRRDPSIVPHIYHQSQRTF